MFLPFFAPIPREFRRVNSDCRPINIGIYFRCRNCAPRLMAATLYHSVTIGLYRAAASPLSLARSLAASIYSAPLSTLLAVRHIAHNRRNSLRLYLKNIAGLARTHAASAVRIERAVSIARASACLALFLLVEGRVVWTRGDCHLGEFLSSEFQSDTTAEEGGGSALLADANFRNRQRAQFFGLDSVNGTGRIHGGKLRGPWSSRVIHSVRPYGAISPGKSPARVSTALKPDAPPTPAISL